MKILIAVDGSPATDKAVAFAADMLKHNAANASITLFHVVESLPEFLLGRAGGKQSDDVYRRVVGEWEAENKSAGERMLAAQEQVLLKAGLPQKSVTKKLVSRESRPESIKVVAALSIIEEMQQGNYDVVCLGRRGDSGIDSVFPGSVAEKVLREAQGRTVWVVD